MDNWYYNNYNVNQYAPSSSNANANPNVNVSQNSLPLDALIQQQNNEVDHYLHMQGERLKAAVNQQRRQQIKLLTMFYESKSKALLKEKEENLEKLKAKSGLLEEYIKKAEQQSQAWQNVAKQKQEMVIGLNNMLALAKQNMANNNNNNNGATSVSSCESSTKSKKTRAIEQKQREEMKKNVTCKWCKTEIRSVVILPCRHLCCCKTCEPTLGLCPICHCIKEGTIEVVLS